MKARQAAAAAPSVPSTPSALAQALRTEQRYVTALYERLETLREREEKALSTVLRAGAHGGTRQALVEREVRADEQARNIARFNGVEGGLCFGRIDHADHAGGASHYIGRIGLRDEAHEPLLVDWRAPAARPFYAASPTAPGTLVRRRHLHTRGRRVTGVDDEVFDLDGIGEAERRGLVGEAALLAALRRGRTGRMTDVVATIQTEQDRVIRSGLQGVLVVQGGPGTGKTVAALHRAAYLLYTYRDTLARRGVLVIGPGAAFVHYIGQVLPSLGETDVVLTPLGGLFPGVSATAEDGARAAVVKGDPRMVEVIAAAVRDLQVLPGGPVDVPLEDEARSLRLTRQACARARKRAQALRAPHNVARKRFVLDLLHALVRERARQHGRPLDEEELRHGPAELWAQPPVRAALDALWPPLTPRQLIAELLSDSERLRSAAPLLTDDERASLLRAPDAPWTVGDVPLLDEAAELLGTDDSAARARARAAQEERREEERYAREVLRIVGLDEGEDEGPAPVDAAALAARHLDTGPVRTTAQRAAADRSWAFGHVIVDEAQELSAMAWRMVMRRVPTRSMTVVGDVAQTGSPAGATSWGQMLDPYTRGGWREERLTVNYRTPAEVMDLAAEVLAEVAPELSAPESVRREGRRPVAVRAPRGRLEREVARAVEADLADLAGRDGGRLAVVAADRAVETLARALPGAVLGDRPDALDSPLVLLTVAQAKGLEFDRAVVADPAGIRSQSPKGGQDLYVAITRVTRRLTVVYEGELPEVLGQLAP